METARVRLDRSNEAPPDGWLAARTGDEAIAAMRAGGVAKLSLEGAHPDAGRVVSWIVDAARELRFPPPNVIVHGDGAPTEWSQEIVALHAAIRAMHMATMEVAVDWRPEVIALHAAIRDALPKLRALLDEIDSHWTYEDGVYRLYHQSLKVFGRLQPATAEIVEALRALAPDRQLNGWFMEIIRDGASRRFDHGPNGTNSRWLAETRPVVEAFMHARYFLQMAVRYGADLERPPALMPSGWAALLCLYDLR